MVALLDVAFDGHGVIVVVVVVIYNSVAPVGGGPLGLVTNLVSRVSRRRIPRIGRMIAWRARLWCWTTYR
jgi:hypothetical protein